MVGFHAYILTITVTDWLTDRAESWDPSDLKTQKQLNKSLIFDKNIWLMFANTE